MFSLCIREAVTRWGTSQSSITTRRRTAAVGMLAFSRAASPRSLSITNRCATYHDIAILRTPFNMLLTLAVNKICHKLTIFGIHKRLFFSVDVFPGHIEPGYCWNGWSFSNSIFDDDANNWCSVSASAKQCRDEVLHSRVSQPDDARPRSACWRSAGRLHQEACLSQTGALLTTTSLFSVLLSTCYWRWQWIKFVINWRYLVFTSDCFFLSTFFQDTSSPVTAETVDPSRIQYLLLVLVKRSTKSQFLNLAYPLIEQFY